ncbi:MAG: hypothetical protein F6K31_15720 [Symploca sp. SIO2G7]|nr:hypothetical protein [Symploca sp. SIO2G7]
MIEPILLFLEITLSGLSFLFSRVLRFVMQALSGFYTSSNQQNLEWELVCAEFFKKDIKLLWAMTKARWNLHAIVAIVGSIEVQESLSIDINSANKSAKSWTIVVYTAPNLNTITSISSLTVSGENQWQSLQLKPGKYLLGLRYYHWSDTVEFPAIKADGVEVVTAHTIKAPANINNFYYDLINRKNLIHICLNYYVFNLLRFKQWLPEHFVRTVFLPVPNPETKFYFGAIKAGKVLQFKLDYSLLNNHDIYFSLYSRECFPIEWYPLTEKEHTTPPNQENCVYVVRIHQKFSKQEIFMDDWINIAVV